MERSREKALNSADAIAWPQKGSELMREIRANRVRMAHIPKSWLSSVLDTAKAGLVARNFTFKIGRARMCTFQSPEQIVGVGIQIRSA